jgi:acetyl-CoA carboxylase biotin carboxyl carrier protein
MLTDADVREILRIIDESPLEELRVETSGFKLHVRRATTGVRSDALHATDSTPRSEQGATPGVRSDLLHGSETETIPAPSMGTFYRAERPGEAPFVDVGTRVEPDTVVGIIEIMKMMNSVPAGLSGTVVEVCAGNAEMVAEDQPLFRVAVAA